VIHVSRSLLILLLIAALLLAALLIGDHLSLDQLKARQAELGALIASRPILFGATFLLLFALLAAFAPGAAVLKVAAGALFGLWGGMAMATAATLMAAMIGFLLSRYAVRSWVERRFGRLGGIVNRGVERDGALYLLAMRFNPLIPFFLINLFLGLTRMRLWVFGAASFVGLLPAAFVYALAGTELARVETMADILSPRLIGALLLLSLMPIAGKWVATRLRRPVAGADAGR
jgi:uncharacterized membrane protein YdjX (TVP38/TMEM64 family)